MSPGPEVVPFGTLPVPDASGRADVSLVPLHSSALSVGILTFGAALWTVEAPDRSGQRDHVALHLTGGTVGEIADRARNPYLGATCGRVAGRIAGATFELDGEHVGLPANDGPHHLHGGPDGFDRRVWDVAELGATDDGGQVVLALVSPDGDQGHPGTLEVTVTYELHGHVLRIVHEAVTDAPTIVNLTNHAYWNLAGPSGWDEPGSVSDHELRLPADRYQPVDAELIPTGPLAPVAGTAYDLHQPRLLGDVLAQLSSGLDHAFEVPEGEAEERAAFDGLRFAGELHHPASGRTLTVATDRPALQVYTGNLLTVPFAPQAAICLEAQHFPDVVHRPGLGSITLRPGEHHRSTTELTFGTR
jgi:aldose 1-epimerase